MTSEGQAYQLKSLMIGYYSQPDLSGGIHPPAKLR